MHTPRVGGRIETGVEVGVSGGADDVDAGAGGVVDYAGEDGDGLVDAQGEVDDGAGKGGGAG